MIRPLLIFITTFILLALPGGLKGQVKITRYFDDDQKVKQESFHVKANDSSILDGAYKAYYANGNLKKEGHFDNNEATGKWRYYFENGNLKMEGVLKDGKNYGPWKYYYENGQLQKQGPIYNGKREGLWKYYYENGNLKSQGEFSDGERIDIWNYFYETGTLKAHEFFKNDTSQYKSYYPSGKLKAKGNKVNDEREGNWQLYHENGEVKARGKYEKGLKEGMWEFYFENGKLSSRGHFHQGLSDGKWTYYYKNGNIKSEGAEKEGKKEGYWKIYHREGGFKGEALFEKGEGNYKEYYESGAPKVIGQVENGMNQGEWKYFYEDGNIEGECYFIDGKGTYKGYYKDGSLKMKGTIEDGNREGVWELYKKDGTLAGYYKNIYEENKPVFKVVEDSINQNKEDSIVAKVPDYLYKKRESRYFSPRINEFRGYIVGVNPIGAIQNRIPLTVEYYMQERLGYELQVAMDRMPMFKNTDQMGMNEHFRRGWFVSFKQKFYRPDSKLGMFYLGHELGFTYIDHFSKVSGRDQEEGAPGQLVFADEQKIEYAFIIGDRLMRNAGKKGKHSLSLDLFAGLGLGYRFFDKNYDENQYQDDQIDNINQRKLTIPVRLGVSVGFIF